MSDSKGTKSRHFSILYIEDDEANRTLLHSIVKRRDDLALLLAGTGQEGITAAGELAPDIILLDLTLPDISGFDVLQSLLSNPQTARTPVIAITGDSHMENRNNCMKAGFSGYLSKPIDVHAFYSLIDETITSLSKSN